MKIDKKVKYHFDNKLYATITRRTSKKSKELSRGYILGFSDDFLLFQDSDDFRMLGFNIFPKATISKVRYNNYDIFYDKIMKWEGEKKKIKMKTDVKIDNWNSIFKSLKSAKRNVIVECENPKIDLFVIGEITKVTAKKVFIKYFNPEGVFDKKATPVKFKNITKITFDDRYIDVFSKYLRES